MTAKLSADAVEGNLGASYDILVVLVKVLILFLTRESVRCTEFQLPKYDRITWSHEL